MKGRSDSPATGDRVNDQEDSVVSEVVVRKRARSEAGEVGDADDVGTRVERASELRTDGAEDLRPEGRGEARLLPAAPDGEHPSGFPGTQQERHPRDPDEESQAVRPYGRLSGTPLPPNPLAPTKGGLAFCGAFL